MIGRSSAVSVAARQWVRVRGCVVVLVLGLLAAGTTALASVVQALSLEDLTRKADVIVVGVGGEAQSRRNADGRLIVTDVSVTVRDVLKGPAKQGDDLFVTVLGGELDGLSLRVPGEASIPQGKPALLFLYRTGSAGTDLRVVGMAQGVMPMQSERGTMMIIPGGSGSKLVERSSDGKLDPAPAALLHPQPAATVLDRVRALVAQDKQRKK